MKRKSSNTKPETYYRDLSNNLQEGFGTAEIVWDESGNPCDYRILDINPACSKIIGISPAQVIGKTVFQIFPEAEPNWIELLHDVAKGKEPKQFEKYSTILNKWFSVHVFCPEGNKLAALLTDVTQQKFAEKALRKNEEQLRLAVEGARLGTWNWNLVTGKTVWNSCLYKLLGRDPNVSGIDGETFFNYIHPDDINRVRRHVEETMAKNADFFDEFRIIREDKAVRWLAAAGRIYRDAGNRPMRIAGVNYDITEHKRIEAELKRAQAELESRVAERTAELRKNSIKLEETNIALNILLKKREEDKIEMEKNVLANVKDLIFPFIEKLKTTDLTPRQEAFLQIIDANLKDIISPFSTNLSAEYFGFTPAEIQIVEFIKQGKTTQEIADSLNLAYRTICFHRQNIRKKLNLNNKKANLKTFLRTFK